MLNPQDSNKCSTLIELSSVEDSVAAMAVIHDYRIHSRYGLANPRSLKLSFTRSI